MNFIFRSLDKLPEHVFGSGDREENEDGELDDKDDDDSDNNDVGNKLVNTDNVTDINVNFINSDDSDLTNAMCLKSGSYCWDDDDFNVYKNVRFTATIDLNKFKSKMGNSKWYLKIGAELSNGQRRVENLAVDTNLKNLNVNDFELSGFGEKMYLTGNHVTFYGSDDITYWKLINQGSGYYFDAWSRNCPTGDVCYYDLYYQKGGTCSSSWNCMNACGYAYENIDEGGKVCTNSCVPGTDCLGTSSVKTTFIKPTGVVSIEYINGDKVCKESLLNAQKLINNCEGTVGYSCGEMTVKINDNVSANISISENVSLDSKETSLIKVNAGMGFEYTMVYTDVVSWKILERSYQGNTQDSAIKDKVKSTYYKYNISTLETALNNSVKDVLNVQEEYGDANFAGSGNWTCGNSVESVSGDTITYTVTCEYTVKTANIDYYTGVIYSYGEGVSGHLDGGNRYYIPLRYPSNSTFNWNLQSGSDTLSVLKLSYNVDDLGSLKAPKISIDTVPNVKNTCYINVQNEFYDIESPGCNGAECVADSDSFPINGYKFIYRSISVANPFPDDQIPQNWQNYIDNHGGLSRVHNSYNGSPAYVSKPTTITGLSGNFNYADKSDINEDGNVSSVITSQYFTENYSKSQLHCKLGEYKDGECDTK